MCVAWVGLLSAVANPILSGSVFEPQHEDGTTRRPEIARSVFGPAQFWCTRTSARRVEPFRCSGPATEREVEVPPGRPELAVQARRAASAVCATVVKCRIGECGLELGDPRFEAVHFQLEVRRGAPGSPRRGLGFPFRIR